MIKIGDVVQIVNPILQSEQHLKDQIGLVIDTKRNLFRVKLFHSVNADCLFSIMELEVLNKEDYPEYCL